MPINNNVLDLDAYRQKRARSGKASIAGSPVWPARWPVPILASPVYGPMLFAPVVWVPCWTPVNASVAVGAEDA